MEREDVRASLKTMAEAAELIRSRGISALIFPEGGRSPQAMREFKEGAAYIAIKAGATIVPIGLNGTYEVLPMGSLHIRGRRVRVRIGDPIPAAGLLIHDRGRVTALLRERIAALI